MMHALMHSSGRPSAGLLPLAVAALLALPPVEVRAEFRHALVIGQSLYKTGTLAAPPRDAATVGDALRQVGFTVTTLENVPTVAALVENVNAFAKTIPTGGTAVVYVSGHAVPVPVTSGTTPQRSDLAVITTDGGRHPLSAVLRPLVVPGYAPFGNGQAFVSGSRINIVILDTSAPPVPPAAAAAPEPAPPVDLLPDSLVVLRPADAARADPATPGPSLLAGKLAAAVAARQPLDAVLTGLSSRTMSSLEAGEIGRLSSPASRAVSPPETLGAGTKPGDEWVDRHGMVFCWCPPGTALIGSPSTEPGRQRDEFQVEITFAEGFWMAKHELSYRESVPLGLSSYLASGRHKLHPLNHLHAYAYPPKFLEKANETAPAGWAYDLPTDVEWEYAARAGTRTVFSFGDNPADLDRHGNFADRTLREGNVRSESSTASGPRLSGLYSGELQTGIFTYAHATWSDGSPTMARVGSYLPNPWGLCDMHGNMAEVTSTVYSAARTVPFVPLHERVAWAAKPESQTLYPHGHVRKGGSWASLPESCRSGSRGLSANWERADGLRVVLRRKEAVAPPPATRWTTIVPTTVASSSGATATAGGDGGMLVSGTVAPGDTYTITCPVPTGIEPLAVKLEILPDPSLPKQGPGRAADGGVAVAEISLAGTRGGGPAAIQLLGVRSDLPYAAAGSLVDGRLETFTGGPGDGKPREVVLTIGLPSRNGYDTARWRYPVERASQGPLASLTLTIVHRRDIPAPLGRFRISVLHEELTP